MRLSLIWFVFFLLKFIFFRQFVEISAITRPFLRHRRLLQPLGCLPLPVSLAVCSATRNGWKNLREIERGWNEGGSHDNISWDSKIRELIFRWEMVENSSRQKLQFEDCFVRVAVGRATPFLAFCRHHVRVLTWRRWIFFSTYVNGLVPFTSRLRQTRIKRHCPKQRIKAKDKWISAMSLCLRCTEWERQSFFQLCRTAQ